MKLSRPMQIVLGILLLVVLVVVIVALAVPSLQRPPAAQPVVEAGPTRTPHPWSLAAGPSPTPHPWSIAAGPSPTPIGAHSATDVAVGGVTTETNSLARGGGEALPSTDSGLPWLIPVGAILLLTVVWWRWRKARAGNR